MTNSSLRKALDEIRKAKGLTERVAVATVLINKTAYKTGRMLYDGLTTPQKAVTAPNKPTAPLEPQHVVAEIIYSEAPTNTIFIAGLEENLNTASEPEPKQLDPFSTELLRYDTELKTLRHEYEKAPTDVDKNAIQFKILRLTRQRREFIANASNT